MVASLFMVNTYPPFFPWFQSFITEKAVPAFAHRDNVTNETLKATRARLIRRWWSGYRTALPNWCFQRQDFVPGRKEDRSSNVYIYIYILVIISLVIFILPPLISRRLPVSTTSKWKTCLRERMRRVSFRLTKGRGGATFNQGCVISDPSSTRSTFQRSLQRSCSEKFASMYRYRVYIYVCVCVWR